MSISPDDIEDGAFLKVPSLPDPAFVQLLKYPKEFSDKDGYLLSPLHVIKSGDDPGPYPEVTFANKAWRRSPFVVHTMLFRGAHKIDDVEVVGQVDLPPKDFRGGTRRPSDAVNFETGAGPWHVWSKETGGDNVAWLSSQLARWPYILDVHCPFLGEVYHQSELYVEHEINRRAVLYGQDQEKLGAKPGNLNNPAIKAPPYPPVSPREARLRKGDIVELPTIHGLAYLQKTPYDYKIYGKLYRIFEGYWQERPQAFSPETFKTKYLKCCPFLTDLIEDGVFQKVGPIDLVDDIGRAPLMRNGATKDGMYDLYIECIDNRPKDPDAAGDVEWPSVRFMREDYLPISKSIGESPLGILEQLDLDWRPETDLWSNVAVSWNEKKLASTDDRLLAELRKNDMMELLEARI